MPAADALQLNLFIRNRRAELVACERLRRALADRAWHSGASLAEVAGRRFGARAHELRRGHRGHPPARIVLRNGAHGDSEWRWTCDCQGSATCAECAQFVGLRGAAPREVAP